MPQELTSQLEAEILEECQKSIGYRFKQPDLLRASLTHASGANTRLASNERMEFLGDAVLGLVTVEQLYLRFPDYQEGDLTKIKSVVVSRRTCARFSKHLNLGDYLFLGKGMNYHTAVPSSMLADVYESVVAAIYLDGGLEASREFILKHLGPEIDQVAEGRTAATSSRCCSRWPSASSTPRRSTCSWTRRAPITASASRSPPRSAGRPTPGPGAATRRKPSSGRP